MADLSRFIKMQECDFDKALREMKHGQKLTHWMWYIFPQIAGLGSSGTAQYYAIRDLDEAKEYYGNEYLRNNLLEISRALLDNPSSDARWVMGWPDDLKLRSCMTLFNAACNGDTDVFQKVLDKYYGGEPDVLTLDILGI